MAGLVSGFCSSSPSFGIGSLQIPPRDGHPGLASRFRPPRPAENSHLRDSKHCLANKDLKIAKISKRKSGEPTTPDGDWDKRRLPAVTVTVAFAMIATAKDFRASWRPWLLRLGVTSMANVHVLGDGASWIWKAVQRALTGCVQTLDFYHGCEYLSKCAKRIFGEETSEEKSEALAAYRHGQGLLLRHGWAGVCRWVGELLAVDDEAEREHRRRRTDRMLGYFSKHTTRLSYAERLKAGRAIGSGQIEGEAKTLGLRLKRRGARWNKPNVQPMASLVCVRHTSQWDSYWTPVA